MRLQFLSHAKQDIPADGDPIALAIVLGVLLVFAIWVLINKKKKASAVVAEAPAPEMPAMELPKAPGAAGHLKLHNVEPKTAAMVMAIVADKMGKPLNELRFLSIKEVE